MNQSSRRIHQNTQLTHRAMLESGAPVRERCRCAFGSPRLCSPRIRSGQVRDSPLRPTAVRKFIIYHLTKRGGKPVRGGGIFATDRKTGEIEPKEPRKPRSAKETEVRSQKSEERRAPTKPSKPKKPIFTAAILATSTPPHGEALAPPPPEMRRNSSAVNWNM